MMDVINNMRSNETIFLVDDDAAICCALSGFLELSGYSVMSFPSAESFLEEADAMVEGVMLLDLRMTGMSGMELQSELRKRGIDLPIIFITGHGDVQISVKAIKAGAVDFLEKPFSNEALLTSIREAFLQFNGQKQYRDSIAEMKKRCASLTKREKEIIPHVVAGLSNRQMAKQLRVSNRTIEVHRSRMMKKMGADSLPDLVRKYEMCQKAGLL